MKKPLNPMRIVFVSVLLAGFLHFLRSQTAVCIVSYFKLFYP